ncbi:MAG: site-2 protease family protein, partial [Candidatus Sungbacteria bacterium]|nr:site-2 protease family protein [Candidatus Sungbacteria bacterium]
MILTIFFFILLLGLLVLAHEWGHFIVARRLGVRVEEFAFGFPPRLASFVRRGTRYAINLFPFGGYVKIFGESGEKSDDPRSFSSRPVGQRLAVIVAGVAMNIVLAWVLFSFGHGLGLPTVVGDGEEASKVRVTIVGVEPRSPAAEAGLRFGDIIEAVASGSSRLQIIKIEEVQQFIDRHRGEEVGVTVRRSDSRIEVVVRPRSNPPAGQGPLGIAMARVGIVRSPLWRAPWDGLKTTSSASLAVTQALTKTAAEFFGRGRIPVEVSGPIGIFMFTDETRRLGANYLLELAGVLSI